ncbi:MAG: hypothetical protein M9894_32225 [Planctomycetes bacterium]|nr:hypothetical protein [Planctomycetota bacterium]
MRDVERTALRAATTRLDEAIDALCAAAGRDDLPQPVRTAVVGAVVAVARVAGVAEWLGEGLVELSGGQG